MCGGAGTPNSSPERRDFFIVAGEQSRKAARVLVPHHGALSVSFSFINRPRVFTNKKLLNSWAIMDDKGLCGEGDNQRNFLASFPFSISLLAGLAGYL